VGVLGSGDWVVGSGDWVGVGVDVGAKIRVGGSFCGSSGGSTARNPQPDATMTTARNVRKAIKRRKRDDMGSGSSPACTWGG